MNSTTTTSSAMSMDTIQAAPSDMSCCDTQETTTFTDEGITISVGKTTKNEPSAITMPDSDIKNFLAKPFLIKQGSWATTDVYTGGSHLFNTGIATQLVSNAFWTNKLQGYNLMRAKAIIRIVINATPFQQGKLLLSVMPLASNYASADAGFANRHVYTLQGLRMLPCVEIDCRDSVATLEIPYIAPTNWFNIKQVKYDWGTMYLNVLSQLATGGTEHTVDYSIYLHFEDLELAGPMVPQMAKFKGRTGALSEAEEAKYSTGSVSGVLKTVSSVATALEGVPILADVMGPVSWVSGWLGNAAAAFGWSKPITEEAGMHMSQQYNRYMATSDGLDNSYPLAISATNKTCVTDRLSLYDCDEMSYKFLSRVSTFWKTISWSGATTSGNPVLANQAMYPQAFFGTGTFTSGAHVVTFHQGPPIYYLSPWFALWRGSIELTLKFAKTDYHSGRLQITWTPYSNTSDTAPDLVTGMLALREIIDLRTQSEITLTLPYLLESNYISNKWGTVTPSGWLDIIVLNELRAPDTCSADIDMLMYVRGGPDFEFACPRVNSVHPYSPQMDSSSLAQAISKPIASSSVGPDDCSQSCESVGERWASLKQFLSRSQAVYNVGVKNTSSYGLNPYVMHIPSIKTDGTVTQGDVTNGAYDIFGFMYLYQRGSQNIAVQQNTLVNANSSGLILALSVDDVFNVGTAITTGFDPLGLTGGAYTQTMTDNIFPTGGFVVTNQGLNLTSGHVPFYCALKASVVQNTQATDVLNSTDASIPLARLQVYSDGTNLANARIFRALGDDFQLSYFLGCPPIYVSNT